MNFHKFRGKLFMKLLQTDWVRQVLCREGTKTIDQYYQNSKTGYGLDILSALRHREPQVSWQNYDWGPDIWVNSMNVQINEQSKQWIHSHSPKTPTNSKNQKIRTNTTELKNGKYGYQPQGNFTDCVYRTGDHNNQKFTVKCWKNFEGQSKTNTGFLRKVLFCMIMLGPTMWLAHRLYRLSSSLPRFGTMWLPSLHQHEVMTGYPLFWNPSGFMDGANYWVGNLSVPFFIEGLQKLVTQYDKCVNFGEELCGLCPHMDNIFQLCGEYGEVM